MVARTYTVAITKLESMMIDCEQVAHRDMLKLTAKKSTAVMANGRNAIGRFLLAPTRAASRFHPGLSLFADWDKFNLKEVPAEVEPLRDTRKRPNTPVKFPPELTKKVKRR